jgi:colicin import membrane protein
VLGPRAVKASANPQPDLGGADLPGESKAVDEIKSLEQAPDNKPQVQEAKAPPSEEAKKPQPEEIKAADSKDTKKPEVKADPKPDPKKETKPTAKTQTPQEALEEMKRQAAKKEQQAVADALRGFDKDVKGRAGSGGSGGSGSGGGGGLIGGGPGGVGGGGGEGDGPGGGGINDVYRGLVLMTIQPHWSWHGDDRKPLTALVRVQTDPQGRVIHTAIEQSSGNAEFDASVMNVFVRVPELPKPPTPAQQDLILYFNSQELRG